MLAVFVAAAESSLHRPVSLSAINKRHDHFPRSPASVQFQALAELLVAGVPDAGAPLRRRWLVGPGRGALRGEAHQRRLQRRAIALRPLKAQSAVLLERRTVPAAAERSRG